MQPQEDASFVDFAQLLEELIPDEHTRQGVLSTAGIKPPPGG